MLYKFHKRMLRYIAAAGSRATIQSTIARPEPNGAGNIKTNKESNIKEKHFTRNYFVSHIVRRNRAYLISATLQCVCVCVSAHRNFYAYRKKIVSEKLGKKLTTPSTLTSRTEMFDCSVVLQPVWSMCRKKNTINFTIDNQFSSAHDAVRLL